MDLDKFNLLNDGLFLGLRKFLLLSTAKKLNFPSKVVKSDLKIIF